MSEYPERGATYRHMPKFIERMTADEKKMNTPFKQTDMEQPVFYQNDATDVKSKE
jgi:hypothetical protein